MTMTHDHLHAHSNDEVSTMKARIAELERMDTEHTVQIAKMNAYIRELEETQRWRKCSEELPDVGEYVICYCADDGWNGAGMAMMKISERKDAFGNTLWTDGSDTYPIDSVTHWQFLPKAPEAE